MPPATGCVRVATMSPATSGRTCAPEDAGSRISTVCDWKSVVASNFTDEESTRVSVMTTVSGPISNWHVPEALWAAERGVGSCVSSATTVIVW